jgi:hypothetical protein
VPADEGRYSPAGVNIAFLCPAGHACDGTGDPVPCDAGAHSPEGVMPCADCSSGSACPRPELAAGAQITCADLRGYYNANDQKLEECHVCAPGSHCPYGEADQVTCPPGTWSLGAAEFCHECPAGYACPNTDKPAMTPCLTGTHSGPGQAACTVCEAGYECVGATKTACAANKWSQRGEGICKFFLAGVQGLTGGAPYTATGTSPPAGEAKFVDCDAAMGATGYYSLYGTNECKPCPVGHSCPNQAEAPRVCEPGQF